MSDITLSLGGKWKAETAERERQAQVIAHLTNQLEGLRAAYAEDLEQVAKHKQLLVKLQTDLDKAEIERDEWKNAYNGVVNKRIERDHLVEDMLSQLKTLEVTTRNEEIRASDADKRSSLLQKEKELVMDKLEKTRAELDEVYSKLAVANDQVATLTDNNQNLNQALQSTTRSRDTKEKQVVSLLKEKGKLFRLVTDLRSTIKVAGGSLSSRELETDNSSAAASENANSASGNSLPTSARRARSQSRHSAVNGVKNMIDQTLSGIIDRPKWQAHSRNSSLPSDDSPSKSHSRKASNFSSSTTTTAWTDEAKEASTVFTPRPVDNNNNNTNGGSVSSARKSTKSKFSLEDTSDEEEESAQSHTINSASTGPMSPEAARADLAKKGLILRLKKQIELLEEKNQELEKISSLVRSENAQLLVRFRGAHEKRVVMEKKLKQTEKQLDSMRAANGSDAHMTGGQEQQGHQEEHAQLFSSSTNSNHHHHHHHHQHSSRSAHASAPVEEHSYLYEQPASLRKQQQQQAAVFSKQATPQQSNRWK